MKLREFIDSRQHCPLCNSLLNTQFISSRKQKIKIENDRLVVVFVMKAMHHSQPDYEVGFSFNLDDNSFYIEFYSEWDHYKYVPLHLVKKFKEFSQNLGKDARFSRRCTVCDRYVMRSQSFFLDLKSLVVEELDIGYESFMLTMPSDDSCKVIALINFNKYQNSHVVWYRSEKEEDVKISYSMPSSYSSVDVPFIPFVSKEETYKRLSNLITFA